MQKLTIILCFLLIKQVLAVELITINLNYSVEPSKKTYSVYSDEYILLNHEIDTVLSDVLESDPSLDVIRSGPSRQQTSLFTRGTNSNHTLVTINGSSISDHSSANGATDLGMININFVDRLHVIKGPMSTIHGPGAVGGVIDLQVSNRIKNQIITGIGDYGTNKIGINYAFGNRKQYNLGFFTEQSEGISIYPKGEEKDGYNFISGNFGYSGYTRNTDYDIFLINSETKSDLDGSNADDLDYTNDVKFTFGQWKSSTFSKIGKINITVDITKWDRQYLNGLEIDTYDSLANHIKVVDIFETGYLSNSMGFENLQYKAKFNNTGSYNSSVDKEASQTGFFYNVDFDLPKKVFLSFGLRHDNNSQHGKQNTYRIGSSYSFFKSNIYSSIATGYKTPTLYEMFGADNYGYTGNPNLNPETSLSKEFGINWDDKNGNINLVLYNTDIKNMIKYANSTYSNDNNGSSSIKGAELSGILKIKNLSFTNKYSHVHAVDSSGNWLKRRPHDSFYSSVRYNKDNFWIKKSLNHFGDHLDTHSSNYTTIKIKNRTTLDLSAGYRNFILKVENIYNDTYEKPHGYNQGGRNIKLSYIVNF